MQNQPELVVLVTDRAAYDAFIRELSARGYAPSTVPHAADAPLYPRESASIHEVLARFPHAATIIVVTGDESMPDIALSRKVQPPETYLTIAEVECSYIRATLERCGGRCRTAARLLGIDRSTLYRKMKKYGIVQE